MNEVDARNTLLVRAFETAPATSHWDDDDKDWASRSAAQIEGAKASPEAFVSRRAGLAAERLASRQPAVAHALAAVVWRPWIGVMLVLAGLVAGFLLDAISADRQINILAPPILAILLWNVVAYLLLAARAVRSLRPSTPQGGAAPPLNALQRLTARLLFGLPRSLLKADLGSPLALFVRQWLQASAGLTGLRLLAVLHFAAAAFATGAIAGLYTRGLAFEYLAGWESTFLNVATVERLLQWVLGPASLLTGIGLPDEAGLAALRSPAGVGENAARWIHLYAVTVLGVVVVPRLVLAVGASLRAHRLAVHIPVPLSDSYFQNLHRLHTGDAARVQVIPYSYQLSPPGFGGIRKLMQDRFGPKAVVTISPAVAMGGEDQLAPWLAASAPALTAALFSLSATPETENHAAFMAALATALPPGAALVALVDESAFLKRFGAGSTRLEERRSTWRRILSGRIDIDPIFVSLEAEDLSLAQRRLAEVLDEVSTRMVQNVRFRAGANASS